MPCVTKGIAKIEHIESILKSGRGPGLKEVYAGRGYAGLEKVRPGSGQRQGWTPASIASRSTI